MRLLLLMFFTFVAWKQFGQNDPQEIKVGSPAPSFTLFLQDNTSKNISFPYQKHLVLVHLWSNASVVSKANHAVLKSVQERYKRSYYKAAEGFDVISIAVQTDRNAWKETIKNDSMSQFINGITLRDLDDEVCKKFGVTSFPFDVMIDESGTVIAINPKMKELEGMLSERKIFKPVKRTITGTLAQSLNRDEAFKTGNIFLLDISGDSIAKTTTYSNGKFNLTDVKMNQDLVLRIPGQKGMDPSDPVALYSAEGEFLMNGVLEGGDCVFFIPHKLVYKFMDKNMASSSTEQLYMVINMEFPTSDGFQLSPKDEKDLDALFNILQRVKTMSIEFKVHCDAKLSDAASMDITGRQVQLIKNYLLKKGVPASRIKGIPKGKSTLLKTCDPINTCTEDEHRQNRRVEFVIS